MFLEVLCRRNPDFVRAAVSLHRQGALAPNTYVLDYPTIEENLGHLRAEAGRLGLRLYPMTKQIGRNPALLELLRRMGMGRVVAVDWMEARRVAAGGGEIGHVGHLVQVPQAEAQPVARLDPEVWTVFSYEKAREVSRAAGRLQRTQDLLLRVWDEGDTFYRGHEGGIRLAELAGTAGRIGALPHVRVAGVTSFPCLLFDARERELRLTANMDTLLRAADLLRANGFEIAQINAPGTTSTAALELLARKGATHAEPGHGMTGTTPAHLFADLPERPAVLYLSEVSHHHGGAAYFYGGGLYVDPVLPGRPVRALAGSDPQAVLEKRFETWLPDPAAIDYYGSLQAGPGEAAVGDTVILAFRPQVFVTRARVAVIRRGEGGEAAVLGTWEAGGREAE